MSRCHRLALLSSHTLYSSAFTLYFSHQGQSLLPKHNFVPAHNSGHINAYITVNFKGCLQSSADLGLLQWALLTYTTSELPSIWYPPALWHFLALRFLFIYSNYLHFPLHSQGSPVRSRSLVSITLHPLPCSRTIWGMQSMLPKHTVNLSREGRKESLCHKSREAWTWSLDLKTALIGV